MVTRYFEFSCTYWSLGSKIFLQYQSRGSPDLLFVATKVAIQMNCELADEPWAVMTPLKDTMIIGYDTYHDSLHKERSIETI